MTPEQALLNLINREDPTNYLNISEYGYDRGALNEEIKALQEGVRQISQQAAKAEKLEEEIEKLKPKPITDDSIIAKWANLVRGQIGIDKKYSGADLATETPHPPAFTRAYVRQLHQEIVDIWDEVSELRLAPNELLEENKRLKQQAQDKEEITNRTERGLAEHVLKLTASLTKIEDLKDSQQKLQQERDSWKNRVVELGKELQESKHRECPTPERHPQDIPGVLRGLPNPDEIELDQEIVNPKNAFYDPTG
jgi:chromosome segregation ATPase